MDLLRGNSKGETMSQLFINQDYGRNVFKHRKMPVYITDEFDFTRCILFDESFYGKTVSEINKGNLRNVSADNRYANIFPGEKVSYWADSPATARAEVKFHKKTNNLITFLAYDDATSTFPTMPNREPLIIIDGRDTGLAKILNKAEDGLQLNIKEQNLVKSLCAERPDCLAYESLRSKGGVNYLFFEKGFNKLSIREMRLRLGERPAKNSARIVCAYSSDYSPNPKAYGLYFDAVAKVRFKKDYLDSDEYKSREKESNIRNTGEWKFNI